MSCFYCRINFSGAVQIIGREILLPITKIAPNLEVSMTTFMTKHLPAQPDAIAPDGSDVRVLLSLKGGGLAHFELAPGQTSVAVAHHTVEEIWYFLNGRGEMWRELKGIEEIVAVEPGVCITIPVGTKFQFRSFGNIALAAVGVTMPPWPGAGEAYPVEGKWEATVKPGTG